MASLRKQAAVKNDERQHLQTAVGFSRQRCGRVCAVLPLASDELQAVTMKALAYQDNQTVYDIALLRCLSFKANSLEGISVII